MSDTILQQFAQVDKPITFTETIEQPSKRARIEPPINDFKNLPKPSITENNNEKSEVNDEEINSILTEIENEISKGNKELDLPSVDLGVNKNTRNVQCSYGSGSFLTNIHTRNDLLSKNNKGQKAYKVLNNTRKFSHKNTRSNYNFIDLLNRNVNLSDEEDEPVNYKNSGFSDTIKNQIDNFFLHTKNVTNVTDKSIADLLEANEEIESKEEENTSNGLSKIESMDKDFNTHIPVTKVDEETNTLKSKGNDNNQKVNSHKTAVLYNDHNPASGHNETMNSSTSLIPHCNNSSKDSKKDQNTIEFSTTLVQLPYKTQYSFSKFPENFETQRRIICQTNADSRTGTMLNQPKLWDAKPEDQNVMSSDSPDYSNDSKLYNQNSNIRKYTYSATKIDVTTRENCVTIIRKIKMDVDITEINNQKNREYNREMQDIQNRRKAETPNYIKNPEIKCIDFEILEPHIANEENKAAVITYNRQQDVNNSKNDEHNYIDKPVIVWPDFEIVEPCLDTEKNKSALITYHEKDNINNETIKSNGQCGAEQSQVFTTTPSQFNLQCKNTVQKACDFNPKVNEVTDKSSNNKSPQRETNRIKSILQKYTEILR